MLVLLDTNVISALRMRESNPSVVAALGRYGPEQLHLSVITIGEIAKGIGMLPQGRRRTAMAQWLLEIESEFGDRILSVDRDVARRWGEMVAAARLAKIVLPSPDSLIAATALHHGLAVMTRNTRDFAATGVTVIDPWAE
jgi:hypothetical protein